MTTFHEEILDQLPDAVIVANPETGIVVYNNAEASRVFGRVSLQGLVVEELMPQRFRDVHRQFRESWRMAPTVRDMSQSTLVIVLRPDNSEVPVEAMLSPLRRVDGIYALVVARDTATRQARTAMATKRLMEIMKELAK